MKSTEHFKNTIKAYLDKRVNEDELFAITYAKRIETIEFSLSKMQVVQCRGIHNKTTEYHDQIINLVKKNKRLIQKRIAA